MGSKEFKNYTSFSVEGKPKCGDAVRQGPDLVLDLSYCDPELGTVSDTNPFVNTYGYSPHTVIHQRGHNKSTVFVNQRSYKWGQNGVYEVELTCT